MTHTELEPIELVRTSPRRRRAVLAVGAVCAGLTLGLVSACSSTHSPAAAPRSTAPIVAASIPPAHAQRPIPAASAIAEVPALRKTIALTACRSSSGGWTGSGTAHNPGTTAASYQIMVFFNDKYARTIDYATTQVKVPAGQTVDWTASAQFSASAGTQCVLRGLSQT